MKLESMLNFFRDQYKNPDHYESGRPEKMEIDLMVKEEERLQEIENRLAIKKTILAQEKAHEENFEEEKNNSAPSDIKQYEAVVDAKESEDKRLPDLKYFRDQYKNPDQYTFSQSEWKEIEEIVSAAKEIPEKKSKEVLSSVGIEFKDTVDIVSRFGLKPEFADDEREQKIMAERREAILLMLRRILEDVRNYLGGISYMLQMRKSDEMDQKRYLNDQVEAEAARRRYHNKLISDIKIAARLINVTLNADYPEDLRLQEEAKFPSRFGLSREELQSALAKHEYYKFPNAAGGFIDFRKIPRDPYGERKYIANWGMKIYADLTAIGLKAEGAQVEQSNEAAA